MLQRQMPHSLSTLHRRLIRDILNAVMDEQGEYAVRALWRTLPECHRDRLVFAYGGGFPGYLYDSGPYYTLTKHEAIDAIRAESREEGAYSCWNWDMISLRDVVWG